MKPEIDKAVLGVLDATRFIQGSEVENLEAALSAFTGNKFCIACSSGTDALLLSHMEIDIQNVDYIITAPFTFISAASVIKILGSKPGFVDNDEEKYDNKPNLIEEKVTSYNKSYYSRKCFWAVPGF